MDILIWTSFLPIQARACISMFGSPYFALSFPGLVTSWIVVALSSWPMAFSAWNAAWDIAILKSFLGVFVREREDVVRGEGIERKWSGTKSLHSTYKIHRRSYITKCPQYSKQNAVRHDEARFLAAECFVQALRLQATDKRAVSASQSLFLNQSCSNLVEPSAVVHGTGLLL